jgi:hypothetical protein
MELINKKAEQYAQDFSTGPVALLQKIVDETLATHPHAQMLSSNTQGKLLEKPVAFAMTERIIDYFKAVEIHKQHSEKMRRAFVTVDCLLQMIDKKRAVGKSGQAVVKRVVKQSFFGIFSFGYIAVGTSKAN